MPKLRITVIAEWEEDPSIWEVDTIQEVARKQQEWLESGEDELYMVLGGAESMEIKVEGIE